MILMTGSACCHDPVPEFLTSGLFSKPRRDSRIPTIGVEIELQLVDVETMELANRIEDVLQALPADLRDAIKPELMQSYLEINTGVCNTVREAGTDLRGKLALVEGAAESLGLQLFWAGSHPFSSWRDQKVTGGPTVDSTA